MDKEFEYEDESKKKFQIKRWMVIVAALTLVLIIIIVLVIVHIVKSKEPEYTLDDFKYLESRMEDVAPSYILQNNVELNSDEYKINLKDLLDINGGQIDTKKAKAYKICKGYVIAKKIDTESYNSYISCGNYYTTSGYISDNSTMDVTTTVKDVEKPVITLAGNKEVTINQGSKYEEQGATANDNIDGDITSKIKISGKVDTSTSGEYTITYMVTDKAGNRAEATRKVTVVATTTTTTKHYQTEGTKTTKSPRTTKSNSGGNTRTTRRLTTTQKITTPPTITLKGNSRIEIMQGSSWKDPGYSAKDVKGRDLTSNVRVSGNVNSSVAGTYNINYSVTDSYGNTRHATRVIIVKSTYIRLQSITLTPNEVTLFVGQNKVITVYFNPSNATNKAITWTSSNASVATVSNGTIYARTKGTAVISARGVEGKGASINVIVR